MPVAGFTGEGRAMMKSRSAPAVIRLAPIWISLSSSHTRAAGLYQVAAASNKPEDFGKAAESLGPLLGVAAHE